jgi:hypothetical protein
MQLVEVKVVATVVLLELLKVGMLVCSMAAMKVA